MALRRLFIIRHGQSASNAKVWDFSSPDHKIPLTELGCEQSFKLGRDLSLLYSEGSPNEGFKSKNYSFSSPYRRTLETAQHFTKGFYGEIHGVSIIPDLMEREVRRHDLLKKEIEHIDSLPTDERFFYGSAHVESAMSAANRMQRAIYDIKSFSRQPKFAEFNLNLFVFTHSWASEAWSYLEEISENNDMNLSYERKKFPLEMENFGKTPRLKNCEYILKTYNS